MWWPLSAQDEGILLEPLVQNVPLFAAVRRIPGHNPLRLSWMVTQLQDTQVSLAAQVLDFCKHLHGPRAPNMIRVLRKTPISFRFLLQGL